MNWVGVSLWLVFAIASIVIFGLEGILWTVGTYVWVTFTEETSSKTSKPKEDKK